jgi:hypothetical protein
MYRKLGYFAFLCFFKWLQPTNVGGNINTWVVNTIDNFKID